VADAMMLDTVLGLDVKYGEVMLGLPQGRHGWGGRGEVHGWSLRRSSGRWRVVVVPSGTRCPLANYGLVAHFPSCSPVVVVVVAHVFEQAASHSPSVCASPCLPSGKMSVCLCTLHHLSTLCPTGHR
jgi:hypothetical protein